MPSEELDPWAQWLLHRRHGGDIEEVRRTLEFLYPVRDHVLDNAHVAAGEVVLDVGTGDGLMAFGALARVGDLGQVIFSDISQDLLDQARALAEQLRAANRCRFVRAAAEELVPIGDASVDVITTRPVLIYVADKERAFAEFFRVLRPGGRLSLFEPINRVGYPQPPHLFWGFDVSPIQDLAAKVRAIYLQCQPLDSDPMMNFDERDLLEFAERANFGERHLEFRLDVEPLPPRRWETFTQIAFNPRIPTLAEAMAEVLTAAEAERFAAHLRPLVELGAGSMPLATAYLWAVKR